MNSDLLPGALDRVVLDGREYEVVGEPEDYSHSPFWSGPIPIPTPFAVGVRRHGAVEDDEHGNPVGAWGDPEVLPVCGWSSPAGVGGSGAEPKLAGHDRVVVDVELLIPGYVVNLRRVEG